MLEYLVLISYVIGLLVSAVLGSLIVGFFFGIGFWAAWVSVRQNIKPKTPGEKK